MAKDFESLKQQALLIKNEVEDGANTAERIGGILEDILDFDNEKLTELSSKTVLGVPYTPLGKGKGASPSNELYANKYFGIKTANGIIICTPATSNLSIIKFNYKTKEETAIKTVEKSELINGINTIYFDNTVVLTDDELIATRGAVNYYVGSNKVTGVYMVNEEGVLSYLATFEIQIQILTLDNLKDAVESLNESSLKSINDSVEGYISKNKLTSILDLPKGIYRTIDSDDLINYGLPIKGYGSLLKYTYQSTITETGYTVYYYHVGNRMFYAMTNNGATVDGISWIEIANISLRNEINSLKDKELIGIRSNIAMLPSSIVVDVNHFWFNDFKPKNGKVTGIVYKNHIGGTVHFFKVKCTSLWSENISDGNAPITKAMHDIITINTVEYEEGELVSIPVSIQLEDDEYIGVYGSIYFGKAANCGYSQRCVDGRVDKDYTIGYWLLTDKEYPNTEYIEIFKDNFQSKDLYNWTFNGVWNEVEGGIQAGANGEGNYMRSNRIYHYDKRKMRLKIRCGSDSVIRAFCSYGSNMNSGNGATGVILDFASKKLTLCKTGDGTDEQLWGETIQFDQELISSNFSEKFGDEGDYIVELEKNELKILCTVYDCKTGNSVSVSHEGWAAGRLNQYFGVCPMSGTSIILKEFSVIALYNPDAVVAGDSISEGEGTTDKLNKYTSRLRKDLPNKSIVLSARGGANINDVFDKFLTEYILLRPKCIIVLIGENGGNTLEKLKLLGNLASIFGIKLFINYCTPSNYVDNQQQNNRWIDTLENKGARFDMALSKNNYPWVDDEHPAPIADLSLYSDNYRHPNDLGHEAMYKRLRIDLPILYDL